MKKKKKKTENNNNNNSKTFTAMIILREMSKCFKYVAAGLRGLSPYFWLGDVLSPVMKFDYVSEIGS